MHLTEQIIANSLYFFCHEDYLPMAKRFDDGYGLKYILTCPQKKPANLKQKINRVCRFCGKGAGETTFKSDAHIIPQLMGNKYLLSDEECDACNKVFMRYENDLANFLGPVRAFHKIRGKEANVKFTSPGKEVTVEPARFMGIDDCISVSREDVSDSSFTKDPTTGAMTITFVKHSYKPLGVYKAFLKIALGCLHKDELANYKLALDYCLSDKLDPHVKGAAKILVYELPPTVTREEPVIFIFELKDKTRKHCQHHFVLHFANFIYQMVIPLHKDDIKLYNGPAVEILWCPPFFGDLDQAKFIPVNPKLLDLQSKEKVKGEEEKIIFFVNQADLDNLVVFNPATGETTMDVTTFGPTERLVLMPRDARFPE